jgi:hypothetical protein
MVVIYRTGAGAKPMTLSAYQSEKELEDLLVAHRELLSVEGEPTLRLVRRQVPLAGAGTADLLFVTAQGQPVVVEVKLAKNPEIHRQVVAQVVDYASALARITVDELDQSLGGVLEDALRSFSLDDDDGSGFERCWQTCGTALRAGDVRLEVVVDDAPPDLIRMLRFLNGRGALDVRLTAVTKHTDMDGTTVLVPSVLVTGRRHPKPVTTRGVPRPEFQRIIDALEAKPPRQLPPRGAALTARQLRPAEWPVGVFYEVCDRGAGHRFGLYLHVKGAPNLRFANVVHSLDTVVTAHFNDGGSKAVVAWADVGTAANGRLRVLVDREATSSDVADAMGDLVEITFDAVSETARRPAAISGETRSSYSGRT